MFSSSVFTSPEALIATTGVVCFVAIAVYWRYQQRRREETLRAELQVLAASMQNEVAAVEGLDRRVEQMQQQLNQELRQMNDSLTARTEATKSSVTEQIGDERARLLQHLSELREQVNQNLAASRSAMEQRHTDVFRQLGEGMRGGFRQLHQQLDSSLTRNSNELGKQVESLTRTTDARLREIGKRVDERLTEGFEKTTSTFADVLQRLALIDEAQKKITALSSEVVGLQSILADKRSRGAFGEVQLAGLVRNILPEAGFALQHSLPNGRIADCVLFLPPPTGALAIDAKFPLESFRRLNESDRTSTEYTAIARQFKQDIRKHIRDIADRYIVPGTTADGAMMFIPAEAVFAEIQAHHPDLVDEAHAARVWLVSPTTLWAILNTACSVLKDAATREQVDIIQEHLARLGKDFQRFRERMDQLARHIEQANEDVRRVHTSAAKISARFDRIERVELDELPTMGSSDTANVDDG